MKKILISITERQHKKLHNEKKLTGCSMGSIIRTSIEDHFRKKEGSSN